MNLETQTPERKLASSKGDCMTAALRPWPACLPMAVAMG